MAKFIAFFVIFLVLFASNTNGSSNFMDTFLVVGKVYCDTCRCGFETSASKYLPGNIINPLTSFFLIIFIIIRLREEF